MKTTTNIMKAAKMGFITLVLFAAPAASFANESNESARILDRIEKVNMEIEKSLRYTAPEAPEASVEVDTESVDVANMRLEYENDAIEESIKYRAPEVSEDIREYEIEVAMERLENYFLAVEESIKF